MALRCSTTELACGDIPAAPIGRLKMRARLQASYSAARSIISKPFLPTTAGQQSEFLTRQQQVAVQQFGGSVQWTKSLRPWLMLIAGADADDVRASDDETPIKNGVPNGLADTTARQRDIGEYVEGLIQTKNWTIAAAVRGDDFLNLDTVQFKQTGNGPITTTDIPNRSEALANPRLGIVRRMDQYVSLTGSVYRAFRSPTMNELYRQSQVGQAVTLPESEFALRARDRLGDGSAVFLAHPKHSRSRQLFLDRSESSGDRSDHQRHSHANCRAARKPGPDSQPWPLSRLRIAAAFLAFHHRWISICERNRNAVCSGAQPGRQMDSSSRPQHGDSTSHRDQAEDRADRAAGNAKRPAV